MLGLESVQQGSSQAVGVVSCISSSVCGLLYRFLVGWLQKSLRANDIKLWGKKLVKQVTLSDLTVLYGNEFHV
jgi:hypothetical protein